MDATGAKKPDPEWLKNAESMSAFVFYAKNGYPDAMDGYDGHQPFDRRYMGRHGDSKLYPVHCCAYANDTDGLAAALGAMSSSSEGGDCTTTVRAAIKSKDQTLRTPLMHAVTDANAYSRLNRKLQGNEGRAQAIVRCTEMLLAAGANPAGQDTFGFSAAHLAAWASHKCPEPLLLLAAGATGPDGTDLGAARALLTQPNIDGDTPLDSARRCNCYKMVAALEKVEDQQKLTELLAPHIQRLKQLREERESSISCG